MSKTLLLISLQADDITACTEALSGNGIVVVTAESLTDASSFIAQLSPQAIVMDTTTLDPSTCVAYVEELSLTDQCDVAWLLNDDANDDQLKQVSHQIGLSALIAKSPLTGKLEGFEQFVEDAMLDDDSSNDPDTGPHFGEMYGASPASLKLFRLLRKVAPSEASVLLIGESGTGKELAAKALHDHSPRAQQPYIAINCGAIPSELMESELFGHRKGSFTGAQRDHAGFFEQANGGTLFLDEITEMAIELQVKLLRVLETGTFRRVGDDQERSTDIRVVAATNRPPQQAIAEGKLREDVYYRVAQFPVKLPPLRARGHDAVMLAHRFLSELNEKYNKSLSLTESAVDKILVTDWPGNIRELWNAISHAVIIADSQIEPDDLPSSLHPGEVAQGEYLQVGVGSSLEDAEKELIFATLDRYSGNRQKAAETLGVSVKTIYNKLRQYEVEPEQPAG